MRQLLFVLILALLAYPAAGTVSDNGDGTFALSYGHVTNKYATGICAEAWIGNTCAGSTGFGSETATFVEIGESPPGADNGICTQAEADAGAPLPVAPCSTYAGENLCPSEWEAFLQIPARAACAKLVNWAVKAWGVSRAEGGLAKWESKRAPTPGDTSGEITDP